MNKIEMTQALVAALESAHPERVADYLSNDFKMNGMLPDPMTADDLLTLATAVGKAFPGWSYNLKSAHETGPKEVSATVQFIGTHTGEFSLPGLSPVEPTGIEVALPREKVNLIFENDKINRINLEAASGGGLVGLLEELGVAVIPCLHYLFKEHPIAFV